MSEAFLGDFPGNRFLYVFRSLHLFPLFFPWRYRRGSGGLSLFSFEDEQIALHFEMKAVAFPDLEPVPDGFGNRDLSFFVTADIFLPPK